MLDMVDVKQIPVEQALFTDAWLMLKEFYHARTENDWSRLLRTADDIDRKHQEDDPAKRDFGRRLIMAVADYIERKNMDADQDI